MDVASVLPDMPLPSSFPPSREPAVASFEQAVEPSAATVPCWKSRRRAGLAPQPYIMSLIIYIKPDCRVSDGSKVGIVFFGTDNSDDIKRRLAERGHLKYFLDGQNFEYLARARLLFGDTLLSSGPLLTTYGVTDESSLCLLPSLADEARIEQYYACWRALSPASKTRLDAAYQRGGSDAAAALVAAAQQTSPTRIPSPPPPLAVPTLTKQPRQQHRQHAVQRQLPSEREDLDRRRSQGGSMASKPSMTGADTSNESSWKPRTHRHNHSVGSNTNLSTATSTTIPSLDPTEELPWWLEL